MAQANSTKFGTKMTNLVIVVVLVVTAKAPYLWALVGITLAFYDLPLEGLTERTHYKRPIS